MRGLKNAGAVAVMMLVRGVLLNAQMIPTPAQHFPGPNEGKRPAGWMVRADSAGSSKDTLLLVNKAPGWYIKSGPAALVWTPRDAAHGTFTATALLYLGPPRPADPVGYGMFFGGQNLNAPTASYFEFLIRNDAKFSVLKHAGGKNMIVKDWTLLAGIGQHAGKRDHIQRNVLRIVAEPQMVTFIVNRVVAITLPRKDVDADGEFGIRIGVGQELQVDEMGVERHRPPTKLAPIPAAKPKVIPPKTDGK